MLINGFLLHYFSFEKLAEDVVERIIQQEVDPKKNVKFLDIQTSLKLRFKIHNFPKTKIATDSRTLIQSKMKNNKGCLVRLWNLIITEVISVGSFPKKCMFRGNCECTKNEVKCIKVNLIDYVKAADDLSKTASCLFNHKCKLCKTEYNKCMANDVYESYQLVKIQPFQSKNDYFLAYLQCEDSKSYEVGRILEGIFYLDSVSKFNFKQGRLVGETMVVLMGVNLFENSNCDVLQGKPQGSVLYKAREKKNYLQPNRALRGDEYLAEAVNTAAKNLETLLKNIHTGLTPASFDFSILACLMWHVHSNGEAIGSYLTSSIPELTKLSNKEILNMNVASFKMNLLFFSQNTPALVDRIRQLALGMANVDEMPGLIDEETLKNWLIMSNSSLLIVQNFHCLKAGVRNILADVIERGIVCIGDNKQVAIDCTIVILEHCRTVLANKKAHEYQSWSFINSFDLVLEVADIPEGADSFILAQYGGLPETRVNYCIPSRSSFTGGDSKLSGVSRLTHLCRKFAANSDDGVIVEDKTKEIQLACKMSLGFLAQMNETNKSSPKLTLSFKKLAVGMRMIRAFINEDTSLMARILLAEARGMFEADPVDVILSAALVDQSVCLRSPGARPVLDQLSLQISSALDGSVAVRPSLAALRTPGFPFADDQRSFEELVKQLREVMFSSMDYYL